MALKIRVCGWVSPALFFSLPPVTGLLAVVAPACSRGKKSARPKPGDIIPPPPFDGNAQPGVRVLTLDMQTVLARAPFPEEVPLSRPRWLPAPRSRVSILGNRYRRAKGAARARAAAVYAAGLLKKARRSVRQAELHRKKLAKVSASRAKTRAALEGKIRKLYKSSAFDRKSAAPLLEEAARDPKARAGVFGQLAELAAEQGRLCAAAALLERFLKRTSTGPASTTARLWVSYHYLVEGKVVRAKRHLKALTEISGLEASIRDGYLGWVALYQKSLRKALDLSLKAYRRADAEARAAKVPQKASQAASVRNAHLKNMVFFYSYAGSTRKAKSYFETNLAEADRKRLGKVLWSLMDLHFAHGRAYCVLAMDYLRKTAGVDPHAIEVALLEAHLALGDDAAALKLSTELVSHVKSGKTPPNHPTRAALAKLFLEQAERLHSQYPRTLVHAHGRLADGFYKLYLQLPGLSESRRKTALKYRTELSRFTAQVAARRKSAAVSAKQLKGMMTAAMVTRVLRRAMPQIRHCYRLELLERRNLSANAELRLQVSPAGAVMSARAGPPTARLPADKHPASKAVHERLCRCLKRRATRWRFPSYLARDARTEVVLPFLFRRRHRSTASRAFEPL